MLTFEKFNDEIMNGVMGGYLSPVNDPELCTDLYQSKPQTFWAVIDDEVLDINANWNWFSEPGFIKFGITWGDVLSQTGKRDISALSDYDIKNAMISIIEDTDCVSDWYREL